MIDWWMIKIHNPDNHLIYWFRWFGIDGGWTREGDISRATHFDNFDDAMKVVREVGIEEFEIYRVRPERMYAELTKGTTAQ